MSTTLTLRDRLARSVYLTRFSWAVQDHPQHRDLVRDLRRELTATAGEIGMRAAVAGLGHPRVLAEGYLAELDRRTPRWNTGAVAGALAIGALAYLSVAYALGTLDTLADLGGGTVERTTLGATTEYTASDDALSVETAPSWQWLVVYAGVFAVTFVLGSRAWRAWPAVTSGRPA